jgi:hypothetical protein
MEILDAILIVADGFYLAFLSIICLLGLASYIAYLFTPTHYPQNDINPRCHPAFAWRRGTDGMVHDDCDAYIGSYHIPRRSLDFHRMT